MNRVPAHVRSLVRIVTMCLVAGVVLASCAPTAATKVTPHVTGLPAISISVPLSAIACTTNNSCVALGTSNLEVSPTSVGEYRLTNGRWAALAVPSADASTFVASSSCWNDGCLFVGSRSSGDLVWLYDASSHAISVASAPTGASGITAISCYASMTCAVLDSTKSGPRFLTTSDGGATWSPPTTFGVPSQESATSLSCVSSTECIVGFQSSSNGVAVYVTHDGGATWTLRTGASTVTWSVLTSLNCFGQKCFALAKLFTGWRIVRTNNFGKKWSKVASIKGAILTLACTSLDRCVVGGMTDFQSSVPLLATVTSGSVEVAKLKYVPSPISDVACGSKICVAIGVTTVMTLRP
jgi:BNR/Asp-box repeat